MALKVLFQSLVELGVPSKHFGRNFLQENLHRNFFERFSPTRFFCRNFLTFCKLLYNFGAFALKSTLPRACTAWCIELMLFVILHSPFSDLLFPSSKKWSKNWFMILFCRIFRISWKFFLARLYSRAYLIFWFILFEGTPARPRSRPKTYFLDEENFRQHGFFSVEKVWLHLYNIRMSYFYAV